MASGVNPIIAAFLAAREQAHNDWLVQQRLKLEQERLKQLRELQELNLKQRQAEFKAEQELQRAQFLENIKQRALEQYAAGIRRLQTEPTSAQIPLPEGQIIPPAPAKTQVITTPLGTIEIPTEEIATPETLLEQQVEAARRMIPLKAEEAAAVAEATLPARTAFEEAREVLRHKHDMELAQLNNAEAYKRAQLAAASRIQAALISKGSAVEDEVTQELLSSAMNYDIPIDEISAGKVRNTVLAQLKQAGKGYYTKRQMQEAEDLGLTVRQLQEIERLAETFRAYMPAETPMKAQKRAVLMFGAQLTDPVAKEAMQSLKSIKAATAGFGRAMGERGVFSNVDREIYAAGLPRPGNSDSLNRRIVAAWRIVFYDLLKSKYTNLKPEEKDIVVQKLHGIQPPTEFERAIVAPKNQKTTFQIRLEEYILNAPRMHPARPGFYLDEDLSYKRGLATNKIDPSILVYRGEE